MKRVFSPPLHAQRHEFVIKFVEASRPRSVLDLGCSECSLLKKLRFHRHSVELLTGVDRDSATIRQNMYTLAPLMTEYLQPNSRPLTIALYQGSITEAEPCTKGYDLITCIEVMEHLHLWEVERFSEILFKYMEPRSVIISMPNAEFNPLLPGLTGFRHKDHKFEWTRAQFQCWAEKVCKKYGYTVEFTGVGEAPGEFTDVGFCSQIGVFHRVIDLNAQMNNFEQEPTVYQLRTLVNEVLYRAEQLKKDWLEAEQCDFNSGGEARDEEEVHRRGRWVCVPLLRVWAGSTVRSLCRNIQQLRDTLMEDLQVQLDADRDTIMLPDDDDDGEEKEEKMDENGKAVCVFRSVSDDLEEEWESEL
ncbi:small RNA 2'-O-methyltransferase isoform 2-T2 [Clarias gariepinus]|uniref:small RNA 2'-O-methyltransferase isoform X2 n=1 Tax=Clarias gariepinus TaxID=13013 RepID=UPI00234C06B0|nr:small RNA 2'-O-methyltransferase isoform X2 [Clarias gariepinus]